jgi:hypothetical protein
MSQSLHATVERISDEDRAAFLLKNELRNQRYYKAKTPKERDEVLRHIYLEDCGNLSGRELLQHHFEKLEIISTHIATLAHQLPSKKRTSVAGGDFDTLLSFCIALADSELQSHLAQTPPDILRLWHGIRLLVFHVFHYDGTPEPLDRGIKLIHAAAVLLLEAWGTSVSPQVAYSFYRWPVEIEFLAKLERPIRIDSPVSEQLRLMVANIGEANAKLRDRRNVKLGLRLRNYVARWFKV